MAFYKLKNLQINIFSLNTRSINVVLECYKNKKTTQFYNQVAFFSKKIASIYDDLFVLILSNVLWMLFNCFETIAI